MQIFVVGLILLCSLSRADDVGTDGLDAKQMDMLVRTYPSFFVRKREEQKVFIRKMLAEADYEKKYKMFEMAFNSILKMIEVEQEHVTNMDHTPNELPRKPDSFRRIATVLENVCLVGDIILHFPKISYKILEGHPKWREQVGVAQAVAIQYNFVFDQSTTEMLRLFDQEINPEKRTDDYNNPYDSDGQEDVPANKKSKDKKKKLKKGPALQEL